MRPLRIACFTGLVLALVMACLVVAAAGGQVPGGRRGGDNPFAGRWEILMQFPPEVNPFEEVGAPFMIIDIAGRGMSLSGRLVASMSKPVRCATAAGSPAAESLDCRAGLCDPATG
jgi:hypothetical protein